MSNNRIGILKVGKFYKTEKGKKVYIFFTSDRKIFSGVIEGEAFARLYYEDGENETWSDNPTFKDNIIEEWEVKNER